jgi:20S proteasome alpha/beta subunit
MTLCVAAECRYQDKACIVCCSDLAGNRGDVASEDMDKMRWIGRCHVMIAGIVTDAEVLLSNCAAAISGYEPNDATHVTNLIQQIGEGLKAQKRYKATQYMGARYGLTWEEWFNHGKINFTEGHYIQLWNAIGAVQLGSELIISTFTADDEAVLLRTTEDGRVSWDDHYAAIGSGATVCEAFLAQREHHFAMGVHECLYRILESKVAAEKNPYVGEQTAVEIVTPGARYEIDSQFVHALILRIIRRRNTIPKIDFEDTLLKKITDDEN